MKQKGNKGFFKELASKPVAETRHKSFNYSAPVVSSKAEPVMTNTSYRMREFKAVKAAISDICTEQRNHVDKRRGNK